MSSTSEKKCDEVSRSVIVRGYRDRPAGLVAVAVEPGVVYATGECCDESLAIGFYPDRVYEFDSELLADLDAAFNADNSSALSDLWETANRFVPAGALR